MAGALPLKLADPTGACKPPTEVHRSEEELEPQGCDVGEWWVGINETSSAESQDGVVFRKLD